MDTYLGVYFLLGFRMSDDQQYYWSRRRSWPLAIRFKYEFDGTARHLQKFRTGYFLGAVSFILFITLVTWFGKNAAVADIPLIVLSSFIHLLRGIAIISLFFAWLSAEFIQDWLYENASNAWIDKERMRRPEVSFDIPHWRFFVPAVLARALIFVNWLGALFFLLYVAPGWASGLERFIPNNFPI
jgi:hypothetical protein